VSSERSPIPKTILAIAAIYLAAHLVFLAPSLEDIDSINFALGLRHFEVAQHQPHPPGYPVYIALGRTAKAVLETVAPSLGQPRLESLALAIWSPIAGAVALIAAFWILRFLSTPSLALWATALLAASPLFWLNGSRPMSDMPGLALALVAQSLFLKGTTDKRALVIGAVVAGVAAGVRVQTACLTFPLFVFALVQQRREGVLWMVTRPVAALALGGFAWAIPLIVFSGGVNNYLVALGSQAGEDFAWTGMLWTTPTPRRLIFALWETFVLPWDSVPFGIVVGVLALAGLLAALLRQARAVLLIALAFGPYAIFHLLFQETIHVRYAMPTLLAMVWLVACAPSIAGRAAPAVSAAIVAAALWFSLPVGVAYGREAHPAFRAIAAMDESRATHGGVVSVYSHYSMLRPLEAASPNGTPMVAAKPQRSREWLGPVDYWRGGGRDVVWFLADPKRTDLALIDPQSRLDVTRYRWAVAEHAVLSGTRPVSADWYRIGVPGWFAGEGWGLTPETGGIAQSTGTGVDKRPIEAYIRRRPGPMHLMIGGRHFSAAGASPVVFSASIDGAPVESWTVEPGPGGVSFLRFVDLPNGLPPGTGDYAQLLITARAEPASRPTPQVAIRQFDIQPADTLIFGFGEGWHEAEYDNATGVSWRWTSGRSVLRVSPPQALVIRMRGESPLKYFSEVPTVRIKAGDRIVGALRPEADFEWAVTVPADAVKNGGGAIVIETDRIYLPGEAEGTSDSRRLGLRFFEIDVNPVSP
jgi:dolichyl-phosphate-mannose-protein mannosyltransferase